MFRLTVLGNNGPYPVRGGACSGYLLEYGDTRIVLDLGSGSLANLTAALSSELDSIDAIILSHLHSDHISDISVLRYALFRVNNAAGGGDAFRVPLYCPPAPALEYEVLQSYAQFVVRPVSDKTELDIGGLIVRFSPTVHPYPGFSVSAQIKGATGAGIDAQNAGPASEGSFAQPGGPAGNRHDKFVYTGDTSWNQELVQFSEGAGLLLADANLVSQDKLSGSPVFHLTAEECGIIAAEAGVDKLLLTHFTPGSDANRRVAEAKAGTQKVLGRSDSLMVWKAQILTSYEI